MNCERAKEMFPDALARALPAGDAAELRSHLETCAGCRDEQKSLEGVWIELSTLPVAEPSSAMDSRFDNMLRSYRASLDVKPQIQQSRFRPGEWFAAFWPFRPAWQFAAFALLFAAGLLAGMGLRPDRGAAGQGTDVKELRQEMRLLKEQVALALLDQQSASERLRGVEWAGRLIAPDERVLTVLLRTLETDSSVNVRLAALGALQPLMEDPAVRKALREALPRQESPLVQAELIQLMIEAEDKESAPILKRMIESGELNETVRERARWGLAQIG